MLVIAETLLMWYEPPLERRRDGSLANRAQFAQGRAYAALLAQLLKEVASLPGDCEDE